MVADRRGSGHHQAGRVGQPQPVAGGSARPGPGRGDRRGPL